MVDILKRPGTFATPQRKYKSSNLLTPVTNIRCLICFSPMEMHQNQNKSNARVPVVFKCPKHGIQRGFKVTHDFTAGG